MVKVLTAERNHSYPWHELTFTPSLILLLNGTVKYSGIRRRSYYVSFKYEKCSSGCLRNRWKISWPSCFALAALEKFKKISNVVYHKTVAGTLLVLILLNGFSLTKYHTPGFGLPLAFWSFDFAIETFVVFHSCSLCHFFFPDHSVQKKLDHSH